MGGGSLALLLEPRCSKFRGELTSLQEICSLELESLRVEPSPTWGASPFIVQGGAPCLHISIVGSWFRPRVLRLCQSSGPARLVGSGEACVRLVFLDDGLSSCCPVLGQSGWLRHSVGRSAVVSFLVHPYGLLHPYRRCMSFLAWLLPEGRHAC